MSTVPRTSASHPIEVGWLLPGRLGLTFAPGKKAPSSMGAPWARDLTADLQRLVSVAGATVLVSLVEDRELRSFAIPDLVEAGRRAGLEVLRFPIPDGGVPADAADVRRLVDAIVERLDANGNVVVHCGGGLGRAGTIGGCVLVAQGKSADEALSLLTAARGPGCPENERQRAYLRDFEKGVRKAPLLRIAPADPNSAPLDRRESAFVGAVLGAAIGDAMGHPTEFLSLEAIRSKYGPLGVQGFELFWKGRDGRFAPYTDDTQMAEAVLRSLVGAGAAGDDLDGTMRRMARAFVKWHHHPQGGHRAPGNACRAGCQALDRGEPWSTAGGATAGGCGSVMRAFPFGLVFANDLPRAESWSVDHSRLTHRDPIALAACAAMAVGTALAVQGNAPRQVAAAMIAAAARHDATTSKMIVRAADEAKGGVLPAVTLDRLRGWAAHEAIAAGVYVFLRHPDDARAAILEGANTPGDSDSIATIAGALVGARVEVKGLPADWVRDVERSRELTGLALAAARTQPRVR